MLRRTRTPDGGRMAVGALCIRYCTAIRKQLITSDNSILRILPQSRLRAYWLLASGSTQEWTSSRSSHLHRLKSEQTFPQCNSSPDFVRVGLKAD